MSELAAHLYGMTSDNTDHIRLVGAKRRSLRTARQLMHSCNAADDQSRYHGYELVLLKSKATRGHRPPLVGVKLIKKVEAPIVDLPAEGVVMQRPVPEVFDVFGAVAEVTKSDRSISVTFGRSLRFVGREGRFLELLLRSESHDISLEEARGAGLSSIDLQNAAKAVAESLARRSHPVRLETSPTGRMYGLRPCQHEEDDLLRSARFLASLKPAAQPVPA